MTTQAEVRPCIICKTPVPRELFQTGQAKVIGGALCCPNCVQDAERAKNETVVFREQLDTSGSYTCEGCSAPISIGEIQAGGVVCYEKALSCTKCSVDLLKVLARGRARRPPPPPRKKKPSVRAKPPSPGSGNVERLGLEGDDGDAPAPTSKPPSRRTPRTNSGRSQTKKSQRAAPQSVKAKSQRSGTVSAKQPQVSGRYGNCPACEEPLGKHTVEFGGRHLCVQCKPVLRRILAATKITTEKGNCCICEKPAGPPDGIKFQKKLYCAKCRRSADQVIQMEVRAQRKRGAAALKAEKATAVAASVAKGTSAASVVYGALIFVVLVATVFMAFIRPSEKVDISDRSSKVEEETPKELLAVRTAMTLLHSATTASRYEQALDFVEQAKGFDAQIQSDPKLHAAFVLNLQRAEKALERFAPAVSVKYLSEADVLAKEHKLGEAVAKLDEFPATLRETKAGQDVQGQRERYECLNSCNSRARSIMKGPMGKVSKAANSLLNSAKAKSCGFLKTKLAEELQRKETEARTEAAVRSSAPKAADTKKLLAAAKAAHKKRQYAAADKLYLKILADDPDHLETLLGRAAIALTLEKLSSLRSTVTHASRLAPTDARVRLYLAWLEYFEDSSAGYEAAKERLEGAGAVSRWLAYQQLANVLKQGPPSLAREDLRIYARGFSKKDVDRFATNIQQARELAATSLGLRTKGSDRLDVFLFKSAAKRTQFLGKLKLRAGPGGVLKGIFGLAPAQTGSEALKEATAAALASRSRAPAWLRVALPQVINQPGGSGNMSLKALEKLTESQVKADRKALEAAMRYASLAHDKFGRLKLSYYITMTGREGKRADKARQDLRKMLNEFDPGN